MINEIENYNNSLFSEITKMIEKAKKNLVSHVNTELVMLYWNIGKIVKIQMLDNNRAEYGEKIFDNLSNLLVTNYGRGYSKANLRRMVMFYELFSDFEIGATVSHQLTWSHIVELLKLPIAKARGFMPHVVKIKDNLKRDFYAQMCISENWSVRTLRNMADSMLFERTVISKKPDETVKNDLALLKNENKMSIDLFFRDPYVLDFLELKDTYSEKDLENAVLAELEKFILEFGNDFAFLARQKRITVSGTDYYIDLLFFHRKMRRLVVIELKFNEFKPADKGQVELYLRWLEKYEMNDGEDTPIGIILCVEKNVETVELLQLDKSGIHVGQYLTQLPPKEDFEKRLLEAISKAKNTRSSNYFE